MAESFFATLECELLQRCSFKTQAEACMAIFAFLGSWYNTRRLHSALGYLSPNEFERRAATACPMGTEDHREHTTLEPFRIGRPKSREWRRRQRLVKSLRSLAANIRSQTRRDIAVGLAKGYETVCCERMDARRFIRSNRGTHEEHGELVSVRRNLSRRLANVAPGEQRAELKAACERHGARYIETPARNSSDFCPECGHCSPENRKSQRSATATRFRCRECQNTENADANAARNHLLYGTSPEHRAAVRRSWEESAPAKRQAGRDNPVRAPAANRGTAPGRQRDPGPRPTPPPERGSPPVLETGAKGGASEAAAHAEIMARAIN